MKKFTYLFVALTATLILAACTSGQIEPAVIDEGGISGEMANPMSNPGNDAMMEEKDDEMMAEASHDDMAESDETMAEDDQDDMAGSDDATAVMTGPLAWQQISLTDARTGATFTLADFAGKTVFVEPMATWCTNCRRQLGNVRDARAQIGNDNVVFIGLSLETNISDGQLAQYQSDYGFDWTFAVMTPELLQELAAAFGRSITSAPSTPHFVIRPDGSFTDLVTGIESAEQILRQLEAARG